jgi:hypothetical protein
MGVPAPLGWAVGLLLFFFVPGLALARAVFPERRFRGPDGLRGAVELAVLSLVLSVVLTVLVGYALLSVAPGGFSAAWDSPVLEGTLAVVAAGAFVVGLVEGAYARVPRRAPPPRGPGMEGAWALSERLDRLRAQRRAPGVDPATAAALDAEERALAERREAEYDA